MAEKCSHPVHGGLELGAHPVECAQPGGSETRPTLVVFEVSCLSGCVGVGPPEAMSADPTWGLGFAQRGGKWLEGGAVLRDTVGPVFDQTVGVLCRDGRGAVLPEDCVREGSARAGVPAGKTFLGGNP